MQCELLFDTYRCKYTGVVDHHGPASKCQSYASDWDAAYFDLDPLFAGYDSAIGLLAAIAIES